MNSLGRHWIVEFKECDPANLKDPLIIESFLQEAATVMGATIVQSNFHHFSPLGVSGVVIIMESHLTIHTWPEFGYAAVDIFTCGKMDTQLAVDFLFEKLKAKYKITQLLHRGINIGARVEPH
ncbi:MAG: adenosylmethionine decarboxylase [Saprospiraceae bacterium]